MQKNHKTTRSFRHPALLALAAAAPLGALASGAAAQPDYDVRHTFDIKTPGNLAPHLALKHEEYAYARCRSAKDTSHRRRVSVVFAGTSTFNATATAGTVSSANSQATVTTLVAGAADGNIRVFGDVDLCPRSAYGRAVSAAKLYYRGQGMDRRGRIGWVGQWRAEPGIKGGAGKTRRIDPIVARLIDKTTGAVEEHLLLDTQNFVQGGWFEWDGDMVTNRAPTMEFEIIVPGGVTRQAGRLRIATELAVVTEVIAEGMFAGLLLPAVGDPAFFDMPLANEIVLDYDLGGDEAHELEVEMDLGGAGEHEEVNGDAAGGLYIHSDIGTGYQDSDPVIVTPRTWLPSDYGIPLACGMSHMAVSVEGVSGVINHALVRVGHAGADPEQPVEALFARLWAGQPGAGDLIAGDLETNVALDTTFVNSYAVYPEALLDNRVPIKDVAIDLSWAPPLEPGVEYWLEVTAPLSSGPQLFSVCSPYNADGAVATAEPISLSYDGSGWTPVQDPATGRPIVLPFMVFAEGDGACFADCDRSGTLDFFDFLCFQNQFAAGQAEADCDGSGSLDFFDFLCFQNRFAAGCP